MREDNHFTVGGFVDKASTAKTISQVGGFGLNTLFLKFSCTDEKQADIVGVQILAKAGYDPKDMVTFFQGLEATEDHDPGKVERFFSSHPQLSDRAARVQAEMKKLKINETRPVGGFTQVRNELRGMSPAPTLDQIAQIYQEGGTISKWSDLRVRLPGGQDEIIRVSRQSSSGTYEFLRDRATQEGVFDTVGVDLVNHCVNDILVQGAEPLFFLNYLATGQRAPDVAATIVEGVAHACRDNGCALLGSEHAEMPGFYGEGEYDLAGFAVGVVDRDNIIDGSSITVGNKLIGIASSGLHSNGYSLARKVLFDVMGLGINGILPGLDRTVADELLTPTRIYVKTVLNLLRDFRVNGIAHMASFSGPLVASGAA